MSGDIFNRILISPNTYQCGCEWIRNSKVGDILVQCPIHKRASAAMLRKIEKQMKHRNSSTIRFK